jgi:DNA-binding IclR family transcriptional regulator
MLNDRENILSALRQKPLRVNEVMKRANIPNQEACQSILLKMRDEGLVKFDIHAGRRLIGWLAARLAEWGWWTTLLIE